MKNINDVEYTGKSLMDAVKESLQQSSERKMIKEAIHGVKPADEKLFWKWVKDLGEEDIMDVIEKSAKKDYKDFYKLVADLGTTVEQFGTFCDVFFTITNEFLDFIYDDDDQEFGSDDSCEYASWGAPFKGEKVVTKALKDKDTSICDDRELVGYAMEVSQYEEYLEDNEIEPKGYK